MPQPAKAAVRQEASVPRALAGIVIYEPDETALAGLAAVVAPQVVELVVFANSGLDAAAEARLREAAGAHRLVVVRPDGNLGLGHAYNHFFERAGAIGAEFLCLLDQDSLPRPDMVPNLAAAFERLRAAGCRPAVVGPRPIGPDGRPLKIRFMPDRNPGIGAARVEFVISSGSLVEVAAAREIGPFRADYFIDAIDIEWCMRANHLGFSIWIAEGVTMDHRLGRGVIRLPFGLRLVDQPPRRLYTFVRNQLAMMRLPHVPLGHKARMAASLPGRIAIYLARSGFSGECRAALRNGIADGLTNRLGPPDRAFAPLASARASRGELR